MKENKNITQKLPVKTSRWRSVFIALGLIPVAGLVLLFLTIQGAANLPGSEFLIVGIIIVSAIVLGIAALANVAGLAVYLTKRRPNRLSLSAGVLSLIVSIPILLSAGYVVYDVYVAGPKDYREKLVRQQESDRLSNEATAKATSEITKQEAVELIDDCKVTGLYYTKQTSKENGAGGELSSTGIVLTKISEQRYRISIADRLIPEIIPIARTAQKTCGDLQFWHDGGYEQKQADGTWR